MVPARDKVVFTLRKAAEAMANGDLEVVMPKVDGKVISDVERGARTAALATAQGCRVHIQDLAFLVRHIADVLDQ